MLPLYVRRNHPANALIAPRIFPPVRARALLRRDCELLTIGAGAVAETAAAMRSFLGLARDNHVTRRIHQNAVVQPRSRSQSRSHTRGASHKGAL